jgi:hypothetical protein
VVSRGDVVAARGAVTCCGTAAALGIRSSSRLAVHQHGPDAKANVCKPTTWGHWCTGSGFLEALRGPLQRGLVGLRIDPDSVQAAVSQQSGHRRQIHCLDESPRSVVSEPVRMDVSHIGSPAEHGQQIAYAAVGVRTPFSTEDRPPGRSKVEHH